MADAYIAEQNRMAKAELKAKGERQEDTYTAKHTKVIRRLNDQMAIVQQYIHNLEEASTKHSREAEQRRTERRKREKMMEEAHQQHQLTWEWTLQLLASEPHKEQLEEEYRRRLSNLLSTYYSQVITKTLHSLTQMDIETEMENYKQIIESEKKERNKARPNLDEPSCSTPKSRVRSATPRGTPLNKSAITMRRRSNSPPPEVINLDIESPPSRPNGAAAIALQQNEDSEEESLLEETRQDREHRDSSQSKRRRSLSENGRHADSTRTACGHLCADCSRTTE